MHHILINLEQSHTINIVLTGVKGMPLRWWSGLNSAVLTQPHVSQHCMCRWKKRLQNFMKDFNKSKFQIKT